MLDNSSLLYDMKILLVDDTPANIDVLTKTLSPLGYRLAIAQSGEKAIKVAEHFCPDLILLDVMMPEMDGFETCRILKSNPQTEDIPVIFITAKTEVSDVVEGFDAGGVDYITKPFRQEEVHVRIRTHLQLRATMKELQNLNEEKNKFLGMAAHDLRNPLSGILGFSEMINEELDTSPPDVASIHDYTNVIRSASHEMLTLVNDLLDRTAIERGELQLYYQTLELAQLVEARIAICQFQAKQKQVKFVTYFMPMTEVTLDKNRIAQVIDNLLGNAIKFSPLGGSITVAVLQRGNTMQCSVTDQGQGITETAQKKLFKAYSTTDNKPTAGEKSTGLGLFIAKKIIEKHEGELRVDSTEGKGATFSFSLPIQPTIQTSVLTKN